MKSLRAIVCLAVLVSATAAYSGWMKTDLTGDWAFTWDKDPKNVNAAVLTQDKDAVTGAYTNDSKDVCQIEGRVEGKKVKLTITCPSWGIECEGAVKNSKTVAGSYLAYGSSKGEFLLARKKVDRKE